MKKSAPGFTLIELLIVLALLGLTVIPLYFSYTRQQAKQGLNASAQELSDVIRSAHVFSREAKDKKIWGVRSDTDSAYYLVSKNGSNGSWSNEQRHTLEPLVTFGNSFDFSFDINTGDIQAEQKLSLVDKYNDQLFVYVFASGLVEVQNK